LKECSNSYKRSQTTLISSEWSTILYKQSWTMNPSLLRSDWSRTNALSQTSNHLYRVLEQAILKKCLISNQWTKNKNSILNMQCWSTELYLKQTSILKQESLISGLGRVFNLKRMTNDWSLTTSYLNPMTNLEQVILKKCLILNEYWTILNKQYPMLHLEKKLSISNKRFWTNVWTQSNDRFQTKDHERMFDFDQIIYLK
jgi:hypothetical protein